MRTMIWDSILVLSLQSKSVIVQAMIYPTAAKGSCILQADEPQVQQATAADSSLLKQPETCSKTLVGPVSSSCSSSNQGIGPDTFHSEGNLLKAVLKNKVGMLSSTFLWVNHQRNVSYIIFSRVVYNLPLNMITVMIISSSPMFFGCGFRMLTCQRMIVHLDFTPAPVRLT